MKGLVGFAWLVLVLGVSIGAAQIIQGRTLGVTASTGAVLSTPPPPVNNTQPATGAILSTPPPPTILHLIDSDGAEHFVLGTTIIRVQAVPQTTPPSCWVYVTGPTWSGALRVNAAAGAMAAAWARAANQTIDPVVIGTPPVQQP